MDSQVIVDVLRDELSGKKAEDVLVRVADKFKGKVVFASSFGVEDQVIFDMICRLELDIPVFTLDTGRLFSETYDLIDETEKKYNRKVEVYFPESHRVEEMVNQHGVNLFRESVELRKKCCGIRKLEPLKRALSGYDVWICGLRREQSVTREDFEVIDWDAMHDMLKVNPLIDWSEEDAWNYVKYNEVPYNPLHDKSFLSIGCSCCTRAVESGEELRAGRWWWESPEQKECGLHFVDGKLVRSKDVEK